MSAASTPPMTPPAAPTAPPRFRLRREHGLLLLFLLVTALLSFRVEHFATSKNLLLLLRNQAPLALLAAGMTLVIITGGIDLSVGSTVALSAVCMGVVWRGTGSAAAALAAALLVGAACGALNGLLITAGRVPPLIVTLATLSVYRGLAFALWDSEARWRFPEAVLWWSSGVVLGLPVPVWIAALTLIGLGVYLAATDGGRAIYSVGANEAAARLSGVPTGALKMRVYVLSGLLASVAAILYTARNNSVKPDMGNGDELMAITMVVLGGTSVSGGEGSMVGTALGVLTLIFIQNGMNLLREISIGGTVFPVGAQLHGVVVAVLLIGALLLDAGVRRRSGS